MKRFLVWFRSSYGDLQNDIILATGEDDVRNVYQGSEVVSVELLS